MSTWLILACFFGALLTPTAVVFAWLAWETRGGPAPYDPEDDTQEFDVVESAFEDYRRDIADLLDANPERSEALIRGLDAATEKWTRKRFDAVVKPLKRDREFRRALRVADRDTRPTDQT